MSGIVSEFYGLVFSICNILLIAQKVVPIKVWGCCYNQFVLEYVVLPKVLVRVTLHVFRSG